MPKRTIVGLGVATLIAIIALGWWSYSRGQAAEAVTLRASGILEATEVKLSSDVGGRLAARQVDEGARVRQGDVLATFDTKILDHQIAISDPVTRRHLEMEQERQTLRAPFDGWVVRTVFNPGEQVPPAAPVVVVADWRELTLKVFLPEDQFGQLALGQPATITVDAYPGERFGGEVSFIASEAEFTPRNVQTQEDRVKSVYAIKLKVRNTDLRLKPGMFADALFTAGNGKQ